MRYNYKSSGILSRIIFEHKDETVASQSNTVVTEYNYKQALTQRVEEANYGTVGDYGSEGIGSNTTDGKGGILIVGETGKSFISGSANVILRRKPVTGQQPGPGGTIIYSYESGLIAETVGLHGPSTISAQHYTIHTVPTNSTFTTTPALSGTGDATLYSSIFFAEQFTNGQYAIQNNGDQIKVTLNVSLD